MARPPDVIHEERTDAWPAHRPAYSDMCPVCTRNRRVAVLLKALRDFGYSNLTREEVTQAYDVALTREVTAADGIIAMLVRRQLIDAGIAKDVES